MARVTLGAIPRHYDVVMLCLFRIFATVFAWFGHAWCHVLFVCFSVPLFIALHFLIAQSAGLCQSEAESSNKCQFFVILGKYGQKIGRHSGSIIL